MEPDERREPEDESTPYITHDDLTISDSFAATLPIAPDADAALLGEIRDSLMEYMQAEAQAYHSLMGHCSMRLAEIDSRLDGSQPETRSSEPDAHPAPTREPEIERE